MQALDMGSTEKAAFFDWESFSQLAAWRGAGRISVEGHEGCKRWTVNHDLPGAGSPHQEHVVTWRAVMDVSLHGQDPPSAVDGAGVRLCSHPSGPATPCSHHQLWKIAGSEGFITQWDSRTSGAIFGDSLCTGPNRRAEVPATWAIDVLARHPECYSVCSSLPSIFGGPLFTERYAPRVVHCQLGYSGNLCAGAEWGLPLPEHLRPHRRR